MRTFNRGAADNSTVLKHVLQITIYQYQYFLQMCNDATVLTESGGLIYDYGNAELTSALSVAAEKLKWMNDDLVASGISDGLIVGFNNNMQRIEDAQCIAAMCSQIGSDYAGVFPYSWGSTASDLDTQLAYIERGYQNGLTAGVDLLALPCIGFNKIGWYHEENFDLIADADLETLLEYFRDDYMKRYASDGGSWKQKYIQFATWNEFGEGHYFYPCDDNGGYAYLDTMAEVLSGDTTGEGNNTMPTQAQKDRIGHLYVGDRMYLRRNYTDFEEAPDAEITTLQYTYTPGTDLTTKNVKNGKNIECYVSLENKMACGLGACLCCVTEDNKGHNRCVCSEGPVFNINELPWQN